MLVNMVEVDEDGNIVPETIIPLIDGGSEAFKGQARVIIPRITSCFECSIETFPPQTQFPLCTVAETPRKPDHCIAYILFAVNKALSNPEADQIYEAFVQRFGTSKLNCDDYEHMHFIYEHAKERANAFNIEGVTYMLTMGVVKNIIPAVASTNAIIAAACVNEAFKVMSWASQSLNSYWMYNGTGGVYTYTFVFEKKEGCAVCDSTEVRKSISPRMTLQEFIDDLIADASLQLEAPSIAKPGLSLFLQRPPALRAQTEANLAKPMSELVEAGDTLSVTDPVFPQGMSVDIVVSFA